MMTMDVIGVCYQLGIFLMKSEQLFEIDRQINQIRKGLEQRQEKVAEWNTPLYRILQPLPAKDRYLSKKYSNSHLSHYESLEGRKTASPQKMLEEHLAKSRLKIRAHRNQLKELDELVKRRNKIRLLKMKEETDQKRVMANEVLKQIVSPKKETSRTFYEHLDNSSKIEKKEREHSAFGGLKGDRVLDIIQQSRAMGLGAEEAVGLLKKQLGIGIENTPFWTWGTLQKCKTGQNWLKAGKENNSNLFKNLERQTLPRKQIYYGKSSGFGSQFESRLMHLTRYTQQQADSVLK